MSSNYSSSKTRVKPQVRFAKFPLGLFEYLARKAINPTDVVVYAYLQDLNPAFPSRARIAKDLGLSVRTVTRSIAALRDLNLIAVYWRGYNQTSGYHTVMSKGNAPAKWRRKPRSTDGPNLSSSEETKMASPERPKMAHLGGQKWPTNQTNFPDSFNQTVFANAPEEGEDKKTEAVEAEEGRSKIRSMLKAWDQKMPKD